MSAEDHDMARSDLELNESCGIIGDVQREAEAENALRMLAEIFVDAMMRLQQEHGLSPKQMLEYYAGRLTLEKPKGGKQ